MWGCRAAGLNLASLVAYCRDHDLLAPLSERERKVLTLIAEGLTDSGVAKHLSLSACTVEAYARQVLGRIELLESEDGRPVCSSSSLI